MEEWIIKDWADNHLFKNKTFASFEDGWEFIYENVKVEDDDNPGEDWGEYYVINKTKNMPKEK